MRFKTKIQPDHLKAFGFVEIEKKDIVGRPIYQLDNIETEYGTYPFALQIVINPQYPDSNANSGIVSIFMKEYTAATIPEDLIDKAKWTEEDEKRADEHVVVFEAVTQPIAWHVTTMERLKLIIEGLTLTQLKVF